jgi:hypothetical protein
MTQNSDKKFLKYFNSNIYVGNNNVDFVLTLDFNVSSNFDFLI